MLANQGQASEVQIMINPASCLNTAAATSAWIDCTDYVGDIVIVHQAGAITGTLTATLAHASDVAGTGSTAIVPTEGAFTVVSAANKIEKRSVPATAIQGWLQYIGTVGTGPVILGVHLMATKKYNP